MIAQHEKADGQPIEHHQRTDQSPGQPDSLGLWCIRNHGVDTGRLFALPLPLRFSQGFENV
jgi:hypothetical protein